MGKYIHIGKLAATYGVKGELVLIHLLGKKTIFKNAEALFIELRKGELLPYFFENSIAKSVNESVIKLEGLDTKEAASAILQKKAWLTKNDFEKLVSKTAPVNLTGFMVWNEKEKLGIVESVIEHPHQLLIQLTIQSKEVLIPVNVATLRKIDRAKKEVHVFLPDGLLAIYLEK